MLTAITFTTCESILQIALPTKGTIFDFCSSWISLRWKKPKRRGALNVFGTGMNNLELSQNPVLTKWTIQDLNEDPHVKVPQGEGEVKLDASTCVVSIDYLTDPVEVPQSIRRQTNKGGKVHLAILNRCFRRKSLAVG